MSEDIDATGRWILSHAICRWCGRPSWDHFPDGVVADRYRCGYCGERQTPPIAEDKHGNAVYIEEEDAREVPA